MRWIWHAIHAHAIRVCAPILFQSNKTPLWKKSFHDDGTFEERINPVVGPDKVMSPFGLFHSNFTMIFCRYFEYIVTALIIVAFIVLVAIDTYDSPERLRSLLGIVILLGIGFVFSKHRSAVKIRKVFFSM